MKALLITFLAALCVAVGALGAVEEKRPNIVMLIADDLAWDDSGPYGNDRVRTPNLDRMAEEGMRFDQAFLTASSCSPSRASIITGRYPPLVKPGSVNDSLISSIDIAPTFLELAGAPIGDTFDGRSFLRLLEKPNGPPLRKYIFAEKNWHDYEDHSRAVRDARYKYIRNEYHDLPPTPPADAVRGVTYAALRRLREAAELPGTCGQLFWTPRPKEEFYDCENDPHELKNLAGKVQYEGRMKAMREALDDWQRRTGDKVPKLRTADEFDREFGKPTSARVRPRWSKEKMVKAGLTAP